MKPTQYENKPFLHVIRELNKNYIVHNATDCKLTNGFKISLLLRLIFEFSYLWALALMFTRPLKISITN